ncbi:DUF5695 domain-containing protein [Novosphingobium sp. BW1]|uniref:DUF5695 domain-containing protein n=1 Tax=Novosphingobium sp. BW1 TaxID=2592621 RepID=UPI0011DEE6CE|nr:DUF5695 domain-containing protein [Novosphingobium sp. BW1]TYC92063.1 hypothetical protein FMM79_04020 [Novosphingobium sp. BW1]
MTSPRAPLGACARPSSAARRALLKTRRALLKSGIGALALPALAPSIARAAEPGVRRVGRALAEEGAAFVTGCKGGCVTSLLASGHEALGDFILAGGRLGEVRGTFRLGAGEWRTFATAALAGEVEEATANTLATRYALGSGFVLTVRFALEGSDLALTLDLANTGGEALELGDLALGLAINELQASEGKDPQGLLKHSFISGAGSHVFWQRKDSARPWLAMFPQEGSALEYWEGFRRNGPCYHVYFHAARAVGEVRKAHSRWRLPATSLHLAAGARAQRGVTFALVEGYAEMRHAIAERGLVDVELSPGMTVPSDLAVTLSLGSRIPVAKIEAEHPDDTQITALGTRAGRQLYRVELARLGENHLTLVQENGARTTLEFFATEPVETMIAKRGAFIAGHRHTDPAKWYNGLLAEWNMQCEVLLGPDNYDRIGGWRIYEVTCDDPGLSKPAFLGAKLAEYPVQAEIDALDDYIAHFVWGGLQQTTEEPWPYGIYGILDWKRNRESEDPGPKGREHLWRTYDYPHIVVMYFGMYRAARFHPGVATRLSAGDYLERAFGTARAMFTVPDTLVGWDANNIGYYNEIVLPELIDALEAEGKEAWAGQLRGFWEHKVRHFVEEVEDLFVSEYAFDSTGFESTQAMARYALERPGTFSPERARAFRERQFAANLFCRGWLEPAYYYLGSDYRGQGGDAYTLTYMAQMGGWGVLDYALHDAPDPHALLRLGHASTLSSWALLNSGTPESDHGYWYPGKANDGAAGGGFEPAAVGQTWLDQPHWHGSWYYSCEIDLGFCGALRAAATTLADDPLLGRIAHGGSLEEAEERVRVVPRDGVRRRFHVRLQDAAFDVQLAPGVRFAREEAIEVAPSGTRCRFVLEHAAGPARTSLLTLGQEQGRGLRIDGAARDVDLRGRVALEIAQGTRHTVVDLAFA